MRMQDFFKLDGFVTDHVDIRMSQSALYKHIALWERQPKRACTMHLRRVTIAACYLVSCDSQGIATFAML